MKGSFIFNKNLHEHNKSPSFKNHKPQSLQNIIEQIKYLQNCVSQIDTHHDQYQTIQLKQQQNKSAKKQRSTSIGQINKSKQIKQGKKQFNSHHKSHHPQTIRKSSKSIQHHSAVLKNQSQTFHLNTADRFLQSQKRQPSQKQLYFPMSYISLQVQNLKLEKQNLTLQKQLLQQQLLMQRREKRLLKDKLKRIKTHNLAQRLSSHSKKQEITYNHSTNVKQFKVSPIKIKIPQFLLHQNSTQIIDQSKKTQNGTKRQNRTNQQKRSKNDTIKTNKTFESIISLKNVGQSSDTQQLLISGIRQEQSHKENQGALQKQFWTLLSQCQNEKTQKKWEMRQALGDIANRLKALRKH